MTNSANLLKRQVRQELRKRRYVFYTAALLFLLYIAVSFIFGETGILRFMNLKQKETALQTEVEDIKRQNANLKASIDSYKENDFYMEKHAREDFSLSKPDEYIFVYDK
ncbi:MAG: septum formation initiator family protein [Nitrospirae bacterium]|nr:septum formation initiator family protein [Nitrospirota bacterium]